MVFHLQVSYSLTQTKLCKHYILVILPIIGKIFRPFSKIQKAQLIIANNLKQIVEYRREHYEEYNKVDMIQLLLEQDVERQKNENVSTKYVSIDKNQIFRNHRFILILSFLIVMDF